MNEIIKSTKSILRANILVVAPKSKMRPIRNLIKELGFLNVEEIEDDTLAWTLIFSKRRMKPFHLVIYCIDKDMFSDLTLLKDAESSSLTKQEQPDFLLCIENENIELSKLYLPEGSFSFNPFEDFQRVKAKIFTYLNSSYPNGIKHINIRDKENHSIYSFPFAITQGITEELEDLIEDIDEKQLQNKPILFNFKEVKVLNHSNIRNLFQVFNFLHKKEALYASINLKSHFERELKAKAIEHRFNLLKNYKSAVDKFDLMNKEVTPENGYPRVDVDLINPFIEATLFVFKDLARITLDPSMPNGAAKETLLNDYCTLINFRDNDVNINLTLNFSRDTFLNLIQHIQHGQRTLEVSEIKSFLDTLLKQIFSAGKDNLLDRKKTLSTYKLKVLNKREEIALLYSDQLNISVILSSKIGDIILGISPSTGPASTE